MQLFTKFIGSCHGLAAFRTEWAVFGDEEQLAGTIDFVAVDRDNNLHLFDWKRRKDIARRYSNRYQRMRAPLDHIEDCCGAHYRLQLNCYRYLLEKYCNHNVASMVIVGTHPDNGGAAFVDEVPRLFEETEQMMMWQRTCLLYTSPSPRD